MGDRQWFILYVLVCLEVGIFLTIVPWSAIWERNYFLEAYPGIKPFFLAPSVRGAVAGLGLSNIYLGLSEVFGRLRGDRPDATENPLPFEHDSETAPERALAISERDR